MKFQLKDKWTTKVYIERASLKGETQTYVNKYFKPNAKINKREIEKRIGILILKWKKEDINDNVELVIGHLLKFLYSTIAITFVELKW